MQPRAAPPFRLALLLFVPLVVAGCEYWQEPQDLGVFRLTTYMVRNTLDWEGGNTYARKKTFCSRVSDFCLEDHDLHLSPDPSSVAQRRWLLVRGDRKKEIAHFFDTTSGAELHCHDCAFPLAEWLQDDLAYITWPPWGDFAVMRAPEGSTELQLLTFSPQGFRARPLAAPGTANETAIDMRFSTDGRIVVWYQCPDNCTLHWYRIEEDRYEQAATPCKYNTYLNFGWRGDTPYPEMYWGTTDRDMCFDAEGKPALPQERRPGIH